MAVPGIPYAKVCNSTMSDRAALGVAAHFGHDGDVCDMHDADKLPRSAIGDLVRSKNKVPANPFPAEQLLADRLHNSAKFFSYGERRIGELLKNQHLKMTVLRPEENASDSDSDEEDEE